MYTLFYFIFLWVMFVYTLWGYHIGRLHQPTKSWIFLYNGLLLVRFIFQSRYRCYAIIVWAWIYTNKYICICIYTWLYIFIYNNRKLSFSVDNVKIYWNIFVMIGKMHICNTHASSWIKRARQERYTHCWRSLQSSSS